MDQRVSQSWPASVHPFGRPVQRYERYGGAFEYMVVGDPKLRPLVVLHSLEYPGWSDESFCKLAESGGFQTICIRRPGFGTVPALPDPDRQAELIGAFLESLERDDVVIVSCGTGNTLSYRLAHHPNVSLVAVCNCFFNHDPMAEIRPDWFARHIEQTLTSVTGARMALMGLKSAQGLFGKFWVTENFVQKSPGDLEYLGKHRELFDEAMDSHSLGLDIHTFMMELRSSLSVDEFLQDGCFEDAPVISVSGVENSDGWKAGIEAEAKRVGVPLHYLSSGDALVMYQSAGELMDTLRQYA
jgi:pimeloyl-ACP methyl ester carboxylesterase